MTFFILLFLYFFLLCITIDLFILWKNEKYRLRTNEKIKKKISKKYARNIFFISSFLLLVFLYFFYLELS